MSFLFLSFAKLEKRRAEQVLPRRWGKGVRRSIWCKYCVHMNVNGKKIPVETISQTGGGELKENGGRGEFKYDINNIL
jgi:hypothetical protein